MNSALMLHKHARPAVAGYYWMGATLGALVVASAMLILSGLLVPVPVDLRATVFLLGLALLALHFTRVLCLRLPERRYQIPRETFNGSATAAAFRFAFELGLGFRTYVPAVSPYALAACLLLVNQPTLSHALGGAAAAAIGFGAGRSRIISTQALSRAVAVDHPAVWLRSADAVALVILATVGLRAFS